MTTRPLEEAMNYRTNAYHRIPDGCCEFCEHPEHRYARCRRCPWGEGCNALRRADAAASPIHLAMFVIYFTISLCSAEGRQILGGMAVWGLGLFAVLALVYGIVRGVSYVWMQTGPATRAMRAFEREASTEVASGVRVASDLAHDDALAVVTRDDATTGASQHTHAR